MVAKSGSFFSFKYLRPLVVFRKQSGFWFLVCCIKSFSLFFFPPLDSHNTFPIEERCCDLPRNNPAAHRRNCKSVRQPLLEALWGWVDEERELLGEERQTRKQLGGHSCLVSKTGAAFVRKRPAGQQAWAG